MVTKNTHIQELYNKVQCANTEMQEKQRQERSQKNEQSLLEELLMSYKPSMKMNNKGTRTCMKKARSCKTRMMRNIRRTGEKV